MDYYPVSPNQNTNFYYIEPNCAVIVFQENYHGYFHLIVNRDVRQHEEIFAGSIYVIALHLPASALDILNLKIRVQFYGTSVIDRIFENDVVTAYGDYKMYDFVMSSPYIIFNYTNNPDLDPVVPEAIPPNLQEKEVTITTNNSTEYVTFDPQLGYNGLSEVTVNTQVPVPRIQNSRDFTITQNYTSIPYSISPGPDYEALRNANVFVNVPTTNVLEIDRLDYYYYNAPNGSNSQSTDLTFRSFTKVQTDSSYTLSYGVGYIIIYSYESTNIYRIGFVTLSNQSYSISSSNSVTVYYCAAGMARYISWLRLKKTDTSLQGSHIVANVSGINFNGSTEALQNYYCSVDFDRNSVSLIGLPS